MPNQPYISLLKNLISIPSISGNETGTAELLEKHMEAKGYQYRRLHNNIIVQNKYFDPNKQTIVLNSHHDTVKPSSSWTYQPFQATLKGDQLFGLGSNDAGASLVSLLATFDHFYDLDLKHNLVFIASAEEENSGPKGIQSVLKELEFKIDLAIVGEPTEMNAAIAEKGLLVIDAVAHGKSGHAARPNGFNAIDIAMNDIAGINKYSFPKTSDLLGSVVKSVTQIESGSQHNVIPDQCKFVIDVRVNEQYTLVEVFESLQSICSANLIARSYKNKPSALPLDHAFMRIIQSFNISTFGSPTLSDQAHFDCPTVKIGPGKSERSHQADEYILISEIEQGIQTYIQLLNPYIQ